MVAVNVKYTFHSFYKLTSLERIENLWESSALCKGLSTGRNTSLTRGDIQKLFHTKTDYARSVAEQVKTIMNVSFRYTVTINIHTQKTLTMEQIQVLLEKSKDTEHPLA